MTSTRMPLNSPKSRAWVGVLPVLVLIIGLAYSAAYAFLVPQPGFEFGSDLTVLLEADCESQPAWCGANPGEVRLGDRLLQIGTLTFEQYRSDPLTRPFDGYGPGDVVPITLERDGEVLKIEWLMPQGSIGSGLANTLLVSFPFLAFWVASLLVYLLVRPRDERWMMLILFFSVTALWLAIGSVSVTGIGSSGLIYAALTWLMLPIYLHTHLVIPRRLPGAGPGRGLAVLYAVGTLGVVVVLFGLLPTSVWYIAVIGAFVGSMVILLYRSFVLRSGAQRLPTRLMLFGIGMAFFPSALIFIVPTLLGIELPSRWGTAIALLALPALPLAYVYAAFKRQFGDLEFRANRVLGLYTFILAYSTGFALVFVLVSAWIPTQEGDVIAALLVSIVFISAAPAVQSRFQRWFERLAYGARYDPDEVLSRFSQNLPTASDPEKLVHLIADEITPSLFVRQSALYLLDDVASLMYSRNLHLENTDLRRSELDALLTSAGHYRPPGFEPEDRMSWVRLALPLETGDRLVGAWLFGERDPDDHYARQDILLLSTLATQVALAVENSRLYVASQRQMKELTGLYDVALATGTALEVDRLLREVYDPVARLIPLDAFSVSIYHAEDDTIEVLLAVEAGELVRQAMGVRFAASRGGLTSRVVASGQSLLVADVRQEMMPASGTVHSLERVRCWLGVPLLAREQLVGVLSVHAFRPDAFIEKDQRFLETLAGQLATAMSNAMLYEETRQRATQQEALNAVIAAAAGATALTDVLEAGLQQSLRALGVPSGVVWIDQPLNARACGVAAEYRPLAARMVEIALSRPWPVLAREDWRQGSDDPADAALAHELEDLKLRATLTVPLLAEGRPIGGLSVAAPEPHRWTQEEMGVAEAIGRQLGGAVERLRLLDQIQENARQLQRILDSVDEGILTLDEGLRVTLANAAAQDYMRALADAGIGDRPLRLAGVPIEEVLQPRPGGLPHTVTLGPPTHQVFEILSTPFVVGARREGWTLLIRNTTDAFQIQQLAQQQDRLAAVGQLAAGIAHDFNNIMAAIILYSEMLLSQSDLSGRASERLNTILQQAQRASGLTRQVLDFSRRSVMEQHPTTLVPFLKELNKLLARTLPENIALRLDYEDEDVIVNADPSRLQQVFMNLALNARDAMPAGGELRFHLAMLNVMDGKIPPSPGMGRGRWVCIVVSDTGDGIPTEALPHIFEPFYTTKETGAGTGLGLAQVYGIVQQHGGHILVWSERGLGTRFSIYLPVLFAAAAPAQVQAPQPAVRGRSESVLVVEDDPATREGVRQVLESLDYRVRVASNGKEALEVFNSQGGFDLVVTDLVMPGMGGMALYKAIKERAPNVRVIIMTGYPLGGGTRELLEEGRVSWIQKPLNTASLSAAVRQAFDDQPEGDS